MLFVPARLEVKKGEQIKFVLRNNGELDHEFVLASTADNLKHAEAMQKNPDMAHAEPNGKDSSLRRRPARWSGNSPRPVSSNMPA